MVHGWIRRLVFALVAVGVLSGPFAPAGAPQGVAGAPVGPTLALSPSSGPLGAGTTVRVYGYGYTPGSAVTVTFNAPYSRDGSPLSPRSIPPSIDRPGDNRPAPPSGADGPYPNVVLIQAYADRAGKLTASPQGGAVQIAVPRSAVAGVYQVTASEGRGQSLAGATFQVQDITGQALRVTSRGKRLAYQDDVIGAPIGGILAVRVRPGTFDPGERLGFDLEDFAASADAAVSPIAPGSRFYGLFGAAPRIPLRLLSCGGRAVTALPGLCAADRSGGLSAEVQIAAAGPCRGPDAARDRCILSTIFYDQMYAIVGRPFSASGHPSPRLVAGGVHLDHGQAALEVDHDIGRPDSLYTLHGAGFAAFSAIRIFYVTLPASNGQPDSPLTGGSGPGSYASSVRLGGSIVTGADGSFTSIVRLPAAVPPALPGYFLVEDFKTAGPGSDGPRLNEAATAVSSLCPCGPGPGALIASSGGRPISGGAPVSLDSTVVFTATKFIPDEPVDVTLTGPSAATSQPACPTDRVAQVRATDAGLAVGAFTVPRTCNTMATGASGTGGPLSATLRAAGTQSGIVDEAVIWIAAR